jgi:hypothetical protein
MALPEDKFAVADMDACQRAAPCSRLGFTIADVIPFSDLENLCSVPSARFVRKSSLGRSPSASLGRAQRPIAVPQSESSTSRTGSLCPKSRLSSTRVAEATGMGSEGATSMGGSGCANHTGIAVSFGGDDRSSI